MQILLEDTRGCHQAPLSFIAVFGLITYMASGITTESIAYHVFQYPMAQTLRTTSVM
jgi:hypothetical protein